MVKLQYDGNKQFKITLPKQLVLAKKWKKGDILIFELDDHGDLVVKKQWKVQQHSKIESLLILMTYEKQLYNMQLPWRNYENDA